MAGAGIGTCVICGRDNQPLVSDICQDCTMDEFFASHKPVTFNYGQLVQVTDRDHPMNGRVGKIVPGLNHPAAIKLEPNQYWVEMIGNDGDKFYGRYFQHQLVIK
jgi:hypothetical protein